MIFVAIRGSKRDYYRDRAFGIGKYREIEVRMDESVKVGHRVWSLLRGCVEIPIMGNERRVLIVAGTVLGKMGTIPEKKRIRQQAKEYLMSLY